MSIRYEVESELNPRYLDTGNECDYYGIYQVVKYDGNQRLDVVATYSGEFPHGRYDAYLQASRLNEDAAIADAVLRSRFRVVGEGIITSNYYVIAPRPKYTPRRRRTSKRKGIKA